MKSLIKKLIKKKLKISFAESCTGGMLASSITSINGASKVFNLGFITYSNQSKIEILKVNKHLIKKYGVIPQAEMSESFSSSQSAEMNKMISRKLRENAHDLRKEHAKGASSEDLDKLKHNMIEEIFRMLSMHLGTPPKSFNWQVRDKDKKFRRYENLTPQSFYNDHVGLNLDDYVCLINCPMNNK